MTPQTQDMQAVQMRVNRLWRPNTAAHHIILAINGAGKSRLITGTILPLCVYERVVIFDVKGNDPSWNHIGRPVPTLTAGYGVDPDGEAPEPLRLVLDMTDKTKAQRIARDALELIATEGHTVLIIDELRALTDKSQLNCANEIEAILLRGRSNNVSAIMAAQATGWLTMSARNQWSFAWIGALNDEEVQKRAAQIVGLPKRNGVETLASIRKRQWLYRDKEEDGYLAMTAT